MKAIKTKLKDNTEPLIELFYQEFPDEDPQKIEHMIKTVIKYAEQKINDVTNFKKELKKQGENIDLEPLNDGTIMEYKCLIRDLKKQVKE